MLRSLFLDLVWEGPPEGGQPPPQLKNESTRGALPCLSSAQAPGISKGKGGLGHPRLTWAVRPRIERQRFSRQMQEAWQCWGRGPGDP